MSLNRGHGRAASEAGERRHALPLLLEAGGCGGGGGDRGGPTRCRVGAPKPGGVGGVHAPHDKLVNLKQRMLYFLL